MKGASEHIPNQQTKSLSDQKEVVLVWIKLNHGSVRLRCENTFKIVHSRLLDQLQEVETALSDRIRKRKQKIGSGGEEIADCTFEVLSSALVFKSDFLHFTCPVIVWESNVQKNMSIYEMLTYIYSNTWNVIQMG